MQEEHIDVRANLCVLGDLSLDDFGKSVSRTHVRMETSCGFGGSLMPLLSDHGCCSSADIGHPPTLHFPTAIALQYALYVTPLVGLTHFLHL